MTPINYYNTLLIENYFKYMAKKAESKRFNLEMDLKTFGLLNKLCTKMGAVSVTETIRRSIRFTCVILSRVSEGEKIIIRKADGTEQELVLFLTS